MSSRGRPNPVPTPSDGTAGQPAPPAVADLVIELRELVEHLDRHGHDSDEPLPLYAAGDVIALGPGNGSGGTAPAASPHRGSGTQFDGGGAAEAAPRVLAEPLWEAAAPVRRELRSAATDSRWSGVELGGLRVPGSSGPAGSTAAEPGGRPWSPAAAMVAIAPPPGRRAALAPEPEWERSSWVMTAVSAVALLVAVLVFVVSRLDLASTTGPPPPRSFAVTELHAVSGGSGAATAADQDHFAATVAVVRVRATYVGAHSGDLLEFRLSQPPGAVTSQATLLNRSFTVASEAGTVTVTVSPPSGQGFLPGIYTLEATRNSVVVASTIFTIDPTGAASPTAH